MRLPLRAALLLLPVILGSTTMSAQRGSMPEYPPGSIAREATAHVLTLAELGALTGAARAIGMERMSRLPLGPEGSLQLAVAALSNDPAALRAIAAAGISPREFLIGSTSAGMALLANIMQNFGDVSRWGVPPDNVALLKAHESEFVALLDAGAAMHAENTRLLNGLAGAVAEDPPGAVPPKPRPGSVAAAAARHTLTMSEVRQLLATRFVLDSASWAHRQETESGEMPDRAGDAFGAYVEGEPWLRAVLADAGFTGRQFSVGMSALRTAMQFAMGAGDADAASHLTAPQRANLRLVTANLGEITSRSVQSGRSANGGRASSEPERVTRRRRMIDSLSRFVPTDSLLALVTAGLNARPPALLPIAEEYACESARLMWRFGDEPALVAIRRMRDAVAARPGDYRMRLNAALRRRTDRPLEDAQCRWSRWPKAPEIPVDALPR